MLILAFILFAIAGCAVQAPVPDYNPLGGPSLGPVEEQEPSCHEDEQAPTSPKEQA